MMHDFWSTALSTQVIPSQEWLMQGSVLSQHRETLKHRLEGLCDNTENGDETFDDHEMVFSLSKFCLNADCDYIIDCDYITDSDYTVSWWSVG